MPKKNLSDRELKGMYQKAMHSPEGEVVMEDLRQKFHERNGAFGSMIEVEPNTAMQTEAQRSVFLYIQGMAAAEAESGPGTAAITESDADSTESSI